MTDDQDTCDICGATLPVQTEPVTLDGWYQGRQYVWKDGLPFKLRQRCQNHPYDPFQDTRDQSAWEEAHSH